MVEMLPPRLKSFEDFQFSVLRLLIIRVRRTQVVSFAAGAAPASFERPPPPLFPLYP